MHRWEGAGTTFIPLGDGIANPSPTRTPEEEAELRRMSANGAPRRVVLLRPDGTVERVLAEPAAHEAQGEFRRLADRYTGRPVAAEHLTARGWVRWLQHG